MEKSIHVVMSVKEMALYGGADIKPTGSMPAPQSQSHDSDRVVNTTGSQPHNAPVTDAVNVCSLSRGQSDVDGCCSGQLTVNCRLCLISILCFVQLSRKTLVMTSSFYIIIIIMIICRENNVKNNIGH